MATKHLKGTSYCGLYCADCPFQGTIPDLARDLRKELRKYKFEKAAEVIPFPEFKKYDDCYEVLGAMVKLRCGGCRGGFRSKYCNIAQCSTKKGFEGCWECSEVEGCKELEFLEASHHRKTQPLYLPEGTRTCSQWRTPAPGSPRAARRVGPSPARRAIFL